MLYAVTLNTNSVDEEKKLKAIIGFDETKKDLAALVNQMYNYSEFTKELKEDAQMMGMDPSKTVDHVLEQVQLKLKVLLASSYLD